MPVTDTDNIRVCGFDYRVEFKDILSVDGEEMNGMCYPEQFKIELLKCPKDPRRMEHTLIHELVHAINVYYMNQELTEEQVDRMSNGIYQVFSDNKFFNSRIFSSSKKQRSFK